MVRTREEAAKRACSIADCDRPFAAKGYCDSHYRVARRGGDVTRPINPIGAPLGERFAAFVDKSDGDDACWPWVGNRNELGYGRIGMGGRANKAQQYAHRVAWVLANGEVPDDLCVLHTCDNPPCVNPAHLFLGDRGDNARDMSAKGRQWGQRKTHCVHGHEYTPENTLRRSASQQRVCRTCAQERTARRREARQAVA